MARANCGSTVGLAMDGPTSTVGPGQLWTLASTVGPGQLWTLASTVGPGQLWTLASTDGLASPTKMKTFRVIKYLNIYSTNK